MPIVTLEDWLKTDGSEILVLGEQKDIRGRKESLLKEAGLSTSLLTSVSLQKIIDTHFASPSDKKGREQLKKAEALLEFDTEFSLAVGGQPEDILRWFKRHRGNKISEIIRKLSKQDVTGFYFLEKLETSETPSGYVCLLREINTIPQKIAELLANGITRSSWLENYEACGRDCLSFDNEEFGMPISQIGSPTIEHIMQCFSNLFGRIGLPDPIDSEISNIISTHTATLEQL